MNKRFVPALAVIAVVCACSLLATTVLQMNLERMVTDADQVFRGTVVDVRETSVTVGGGTLPALEYTLRVDETFKGSYNEVKGVTLAEFKVVGSLKQYEARRPVIPGFPILEEGQEYLLMVAPAGPAGLTAMMGLGQGTFSISGRDEAKVALNGAGNHHLFAGMNVNLQDGGPVPYADLANLIRDIVGGSN